MNQPPSAPRTPAQPDDRKRESFPENEEMDPVGEPYPKHAPQPKDPQPDGDDPPGADPPFSPDREPDIPKDPET